ncbi:MAG: hypothetical protein KJ886_03515 [Candidatus Thermoplasmatota archaeon]|nr:hypothetical protein [Candidatus Thermoplasmatota archaeon]MBU4256493.1 hypothetical protein [Candidatus Thermoplasmatota archaeon]
MKELLHVCENNGIEPVWKIMKSGKAEYEGTYLVLTDKAIFAMAVATSDGFTAGRGEILQNKYRILTEKHPPEPFFKEGILAPKPVDAGERLLWEYWLERKRGAKPKTQSETIQNPWCPKCDHLMKKEGEWMVCSNCDYMEKL